VLIIATDHALAETNRRDPLQGTPLVHLGKRDGSTTLAFRAVIIDRLAIDINLLELVKAIEIGVAIPARQHATYDEPRDFTLK
jgi:hypothetical protein